MKDFVERRSLREAQHALKTLQNLLEQHQSWQGLMLSDDFKVEIDRLQNNLLNAIDSNDPHLCQTALKEADFKIANLAEALHKEILSSLPLADFFANKPPKSNDSDF